MTKGIKLWFQGGIDPSPLIAGRRLAGGSLICNCTLDLWLYFIGEEPGSLVLKGLTHGGICIASGSMPNILDLFRRPSFTKGLEIKGRMSSMRQGNAHLFGARTLTGMYGAALAVQSL